MVTDRIRGKGKPKLHLYIAEHMEALGLSDAVLAGRMNVERVTVTRWRNGRDIKPERVAQMADAMGYDDATKLFRHPEKPSLDDIANEAPEDVREKIYDAVRLMARKG